jgi:hypothetical protein
VPEHGRAGKAGSRLLVPALAGDSDRLVDGPSDVRRGVALRGRAGRLTPPENELVTARLKHH